MNKEETLYFYKLISLPADRGNKTPKMTHPCFAHIVSYAGRVGEVSIQLNSVLASPHRVCSVLRGHVPSPFLYMVFIERWGFSVHRPPHPHINRHFYNLGLNEQPFSGVWLGIPISLNILILSLDIWPERNQAVIEVSSSWGSLWPCGQLCYILLHNVSSPCNTWNCGNTEFSAIIF